MRAVFSHGNYTFLTQGFLPSTAKSLLYLGKQSQQKSILPYATKFFGKMPWILYIKTMSLYLSSTTLMQRHPFSLAFLLFCLFAKSFTLHAASPQKSNLYKDHLVQPTPRLTLQDSAKSNYADSENSDSDAASKKETRKKKATHIKQEKKAIQKAIKHMERNNHQTITKQYTYPLTANLYPQPMETNPYTASLSASYLNKTHSLDRHKQHHVSWYDDTINTFARRPQQDPNSKTGAQFCQPFQEPANGDNLSHGNVPHNNLTPQQSTLKFRGGPSQFLPTLSPNNANNLGYINITNPTPNSLNYPYNSNQNGSKLEGTTLSPKQEENKIDQLLLIMAVCLIIVYISYRYIVVPTIKHKRNYPGVSRRKEHSSLYYTTWRRP